MKLLSLNVALFESNNHQLQEFIHDQQLDILCLQEVTKSLDSAAKAEYISKDAIDAVTPDLAQAFFAPVWVVAKFEKADFHGQAYFKFDLGGKVEFGNYLKTKYEIVKGQNVFVQNHFTYVTDWSNWPEEDYRAFQVTDLLIQNQPLRIINYHGIWSKDKRGTAQTQRACEMIRDCGLETNQPMIICGDFNLFPDTASIQVLNREFTNLSNAYNIRSTRPVSNELNHEARNVVDYVFVSQHIKVNSFAVLDINVSDHLPLILDFELEPSF